MLEALPLDDERDLEAQIEISFWGRALGNPGTPRAAAHASSTGFAARLRAPSRRGRRAGRAARPTATSTWLPTSCVVLIDGLSAQRVLYPGRVTAARQRQMLSELLDSFRPR